MAVQYGCLVWDIMCDVLGLQVFNCILGFFFFFFFLCKTIFFKLNSQSGPKGILLAMFGGGCLVALLCLVQCQARLQAACPVLSLKLSPLAFLVWPLAFLWPASWLLTLAVSLATTVFGLVLVDCWSVRQARAVQRKLAAQARAKFTEAQAAKAERAAERKKAFAAETERRAVLRAARAARAAQAERDAEAARLSVADRKAGKAAADCATPAADTPKPPTSKPTQTAMPPTVSTKAATEATAWLKSVLKRRGTRKARVNAQKQWELLERHFAIEAATVIIR